MKKEKKFSIPEADIMLFSAEDIIVTSNEEDEWFGQGNIGSVDGPNVP